MERPVRWEIDSTRYHGPNVVSYELVTRLIRTPLIGTYLPLSTIDHLPDMEEALKLCKDSIVLGDLNMYL